MGDETRPGRNAGLLFAVTSLFWCSLYSYSHFINPELIRMGQNAAFMGLVSGAFGLTQTLLRLPLGMAADRLGRQKPFVVLGCLLSCLVAAGFLMAYTPAGFLLFRGLAGVASASWVCFTVMFSGYFSAEEGPRRISQLNIANMAGRLAGYLLIILIVPALGIRSSFAFSLATGAAAFLFSLGLKEANAGRQGITLKQMAAVARDRNLRACAIAGVLCQMVAFSTYYGFTVNAAKALGADSAQISWLSVALLLPTLAVNYLVGFHLLKRFSSRHLVAFGFLAGGLYSALVPLAGNLGTLYAIQALGGLGSSLTFAVLLGQSVRDVPRDRRAVAMGFFQAVYGIGMTLGPVLAGILIDRIQLRNTFFIIAGFAVLSSALTWRLLDVPRPSGA